MLLRDFESKACAAKHSSRSVADRLRKKGAAARIANEITAVQQYRYWLGRRAPTRERCATCLRAGDARPLAAGQSDRQTATPLLRPLAPQQRPREGTDRLADMIVGRI